jgi:hypothetical protein
MDCFVTLFLAMTVSIYPKWLLKPHSGAPSREESSGEKRPTAGGQPLAAWPLNGMAASGERLSERAARVSLAARG